MTADQEFSYDSVADRYARMVDSAPYNAFYERPAMLAIVDRIGIRNRRVLDVGCGTGWYALQLSERGALVTGIDASERMLFHARSRLNHQSESRHEDAPTFLAGNISEGLPFRSEYFDFAIAPLMMHYIREWGPALAELRRVLVPDARFLFSTHHPAHEAQRLAADGFDVLYDEVQLVQEEWDDIGCVQFYRRSLNRIADALTDAGFVIERFIEPVPTDGFRALKPDSYAKLLQRPEFLIVQARR